MGVNLWGIIHGIRAFLPPLLAQGDGHIVNTSSWAGLVPGLSGPVYDATKHAVVALSEDLYTAMAAAGALVGVSVLCPGRTEIGHAERNWPASLGTLPPPSTGPEGFGPPSSWRRLQTADVVFDAISDGRFWVFPHPDLMEVAAQRWRTITAGQNPQVVI
jgi:NAD(P)-dependent dehydrogenase (short-subunit alcohol dehydrogenase family)